jgi:uncharacterized protein (TIGR03067 family)
MKLNVGVSKLIICFCTTIFCSCNCSTELEGPWIGCQIRKPLIDWTLAIQGHQFHLIREEFDMWYKGRIRLNSNCLLKKIDLLIHDTHERSQNGKTMLGIYKINSGTLTVVLGSPGKPARPLSLDEPRDAVVFNFVRS